MVKIPKDSWWDGSFCIEGKKKYILVSPEFQGFREPDEEQLACGHFRVIKVWNSRKYYSRRRVCKECALGRLGAMSSVNRTEVQVN
jgi:hypothetical protein